LIQGAILNLDPTIPNPKFMKINRVATGKYSEIQLEDGKKIFFSVLPDRITVSRMSLRVPTKKLWEYIFPFYIRTSNEAWESSEQILRITIDSIKHVKTQAELMKALESDTNEVLKSYVRDHGEEARNLSVDKVGTPAMKKMLNPKDLIEIEKIVHAYGKVQEEVSQQLISKYPTMTFPESLLPHPKEKVEHALKEAVKYTDDHQMVENLKSCLVFLEGFIDDDEADKKNKDVLEKMRARKSKKD